MHKRSFLLVILILAVSATLAAEVFIAAVSFDGLTAQSGTHDAQANIRLLRESGFDILYYDQGHAIVSGTESSARQVPGLQRLAEYPPKYKLYLVDKLPKPPTQWPDRSARILYEMDAAYLAERGSSNADLASLLPNHCTELNLTPLRLIDRAPLPPYARELRTDIVQMVSLVEADSVLARIQALQDFQTRYAYASNRLEVAQWIQQQFQDFGLADAQLQEFSYNGTQQYNVSATLPGSLYPDQYIVIGGHHDSTCRATSGDPYITAPGADDNASGTVAVLEIARVMMLSGYQPKVSIRFNTYAAEEQGLRGSDFDAAATYAAGDDIRLMINFDMVANNSHTPSDWQVRLMPYDGCLDYTDYAIQATEQYTSLDAWADQSWWNSASSDSYSYWQRGYNAIYFFEADFSPVYHSVDDIVANLDPLYCAEVVKGALACAAIFGDMDNEPAAPVALPASNVSTDSFLAGWDPVLGAQGYILDVYTYEPGETASDLFFSEYLEGNYNNKALEIFNGTGAAVDLDDYILQYYSGASTSPTISLELSGLLEDGQVLVIANPDAFPQVLERADLTSGVASFDGDDQLALFKESTSSFVDIFGRIGTDPGYYWGTSPLITYNKTLARKKSVTGGVTANPASGFPTLATEWDVFERDSYTGLGSHSLANRVYVAGFEGYDAGASTSVLVTGLAPETYYYYTVRADYGFGSFAGSAEIGILTLPEGTLPVELSSFTAYVSTQNQVCLQWTTQSETGLTGYRIHRGNSDNLGQAIPVSHLIPAVNGTQTQVYSYTDSELTESGIYHYWLCSLELDGGEQFYGPVSVAFESVEFTPSPEIPLVTALESPYPNPFNPNLLIPFGLADKTAVRIRIFNHRGQLIRDFDLGTKLPGHHSISWNGEDREGLACGGGIYLISMDADGGTYRRKAVLIK
jgi:hypothetical protein